MASEIQLEIVTPLRQAFHGKVLQVILPAWEGQEGVLPEHDDKLALLRGGVCTVITASGEQRFAIGRGFAEMGADHVTLLTDACTPAAEVDKAAAQAELTELEAELARTEWTSEAATALQARIEVARARLEV